MKAGAYPGQAILMSRFIGVLNTTGTDMENRGNFFALMFFAMACGALVLYFVIGWTANIVAQVSLKHNLSQSRFEQRLISARLLITSSVSKS